MYLSLSQATALGFLAPIGTIILSKVLNQSTLGLIDIIAAISALVGVLLIIQPDNPIVDIHVATSEGRITDGYIKLKGLFAGLVGAIGTTVSWISIALGNTGEVQAIWS